ncbi:hypothetical protein ColKHC_08787 [Colletotrichum higginsianum]|nr:hypothetical protein ColKHC_08787 [Colletotrichum higginsianum]
MLPPKAKFVREIERGRYDKTAPPLHLRRAPPPDTTYFARVLRRCRHDDHNDDSDPYAPTLPIYEKESDTASLFTVRRGASTRNAGVPGVTPAPGGGASAVTGPSTSPGTVGTSRRRRRGGGGG